MTPGDLASLLAPVEADEFLRTCWGQNFLHVRGTPLKFSELLPWAALNRILEQHRLEPPRLRLTLEGKPVPPAAYLSFQTNRKRATQTIPRLDAAQLTRQLSEGATLVLDAVDELFPPVTDLVEALERVFRVRVQVNAYAGWRTSHGFDLHWDEHDVFVLQVAGRKHWKVYGMTRKYPLGKDVESGQAPATPLWEGMLENGDVLYIPRGWWHVATPLNEPTLHLTVGVNNPTGADLLAWFAGRMRKLEDVRRDLPQFAGVEQQAAYIRQLGDLFVSEWQTDLMETYLADLDAKARPRPRLSLPWSAAGVLPPEDAPFRVKWNGARPPALDIGAGEVLLTARGRRWKFAAAAKPVLELLTSGEVYTVASLSGTLAPETLRAFLRELLVSGLIAVVDV